MKKFSRIFFLILSISQFSFAQQSAIYVDDNQDYNKAVLLYKEKQFQAAQILFDKVKNTSTSEEIISDCDYYIANCAIKTNQSGADALMESFIENHPTSTKRNSAYTEVAQYYFAEGNYSQSLKWYENIHEPDLSASDMEKANFQRGYANFATKNNKEASKYLNKVANSKEYGNQAKYYLGYLAYEGDNYQEANELFGQVSDQDKYKEKMGYFQADMNFKLGNFQKAIDLGEPQLKKSNALEKSELSKIIGESYFNLKKYDKALPYLQAYRGKNGKWTNTDYYQLGYVFYQQKDYENAITQFNKIIEGNDFVAQNAYYHLAESYLNTDRKQQALNAFKTASEMTFDAKIQEDAALNYTKLSYEIGNPYVSTPEILKSFMDKYPSNPNNQELKSLLINSYITSKNYTEALVLLEKNKTPENKAAYQKVSFYRGLEVYTDGKYQEAYALFKKSLSENKDPKITARATFWKGECEYSLDQFSEAVLTYKQFLNNGSANETPEMKTVNYNLGYAYFKVKEYENAIPFFQAQINANKEDKTRLSDAYLRMADCNYISSKYWPAMDAYNKAIELKCVDADYAAFQKGMSYGFVNKNDKKIEDLNKFVSTYKTSQYLDDALYELANTYTAEEQNDKAIATFDVIVNNHKTSSYVAKSILKQGLIYYNTDKDDPAIVKFKKVVAEFPNSPESLEAVSTAKNIYKANGKMVEYAAWVKTLSFVEVTDAELDDDTYEYAEKQYLANNPKKAIEGFTGYLAQFPNGLHALKVHFYLAQLYFADKLEKNAVPHYEYVISKPRSEFTEQALVRLSEIHLKDKNCDAAIPVLKRLETEAEYPQNTTFAQANLMKCYYEKLDYANSEIYSDKVLKNPKMDDKIKSDAQIIIARSAIKTNNDAKAKEAYAKLLKIAKGELAAEALYYDAYFKNKEGKFEASNKAVEKYSSTYSGYKYFGAKSLVLMAKNYYGLKDSFQATEILQSIIDNFDEFPDVVTECQTELDKIKAEEAKTNSSVTK
ncbi:tetratricopeptide repeat protein [Flavobacterium urocaniciphilum]|uniref:Tetratricopeptide repeat-containing protein n=1 Tax=Flavobacterium urocaniciphilum TaxID=1299341 RepID=A0A1H9D0H0_9FLAO|nr:tetratricopeptide repeat protein [Flavobacterium urocaniciphilum]SEQ06258.1 Tetratricopeptide repeat-containing protein [Flavobacterium urocaniciphilum]